jgi:hypothetical protein
MDMLKRNIGLVIFGAVSLALAAVMLFFIHRHNVKAGELEGLVKSQQEFFDSVRKGEVAVTAENLKIAEANLLLTKTELANLRAELWRRSHIPLREVSGVECKNILRQGTLELLRQLERSGIAIGAGARDFSFGSILQADTVPREKDVPKILKHLDVIQEVVRLAQESYVSEIVNIQRLHGLRVVETDFYTVMPMSVTVTGESRALRKFITQLQKEASYVFYIPYCTLSAEDRAVSEAGRRPVATATETPASPRRAAGPDMGMHFLEPVMPYTQPGARTAPESGEEVKTETLDKASRNVVLTDLAKAEIRLDFIQFRNPKTAEEM